MSEMSERAYHEAMMSESALMDEEGEEDDAEQAFYEARETTMLAWYDTYATAKRAKEDAWVNFTKAEVAAHWANEKAWESFEYGEGQYEAWGSYGAALRVKDRAWANYESANRAETEARENHEKAKRAETEAEAAYEVATRAKDKATRTAEDAYAAYDKAKRAEEEQQ